MAACGSIILILIYLFIVLVIWNERHQEKKFKKKYRPAKQAMKKEPE